MLRRLPLALAAGLSILATAVPGRAEATKTRGLLSADRTVDWVREHLVPPPRFRPYPACDAYRLTRGAGLDVVDTYALRAVTGAGVLNFMTACEVAASPGRLVLRGGDSPAAAGNPGLVLAYDARSLQAKVDPVDTEDSRLKRVWGPRVFRIQLVARKPARRGTFTVRVTRAGS